MALMGGGMRGQFCVVDWKWDVKALGGHLKAVSGKVGSLVLGPGCHSLQSSNGQLVWSGLVHAMLWAGKSKQGPEHTRTRTHQIINGPVVKVQSNASWT